MSELSVPTEAVLAAVQGQRNQAYDEVAQLRALAQQLVDERDQARAEAERLRDGAGVDLA